ncbi:MAG: metal-sensitive transcriptional regulator [Thermaceae bacterium]|nr:metal-sensitive transcriptional regulator [Thermaceae bacterium]
MREGPKEQILNRLATSYGHLAAIRRMVREEIPLLETIRQVQAVRSALLNVEELLVREALTHCLVSKHSRLPQEVVEEISGVLGIKSNPGEPNP